MTYKHEVIKVNLSTPFLTRARCKACGKHPTIYYYARNPVMWNNPRKVLEQFAFYIGYFKRACSDFYLDDSPASFTKANYFSYEVPFKGFNPKLHRTRGAHPVFNYTEFVACECGESIWAFTDKSIRSRPEIVMRKAKYNFPQKFNF